MVDESVKATPIGIIRYLRKQLRITLRNKIEEFDPEDQATLIFTTASLLETHFSPKDIADLVGTSRTSIVRWAEGQNVPRSPGYRRWAVQTMLAHLTSTIQSDTVPDYEVA
jgi:transcriptional regulator with XRE-family HTH domain